MTTILATSALAMAAGSTSAADMADSMAIVSWGGAYSAAQLHAYDEPYMKKTGTKIVHNESAATSVAKLRAMHEAHNVTWDLVDVVASDSIRLCDEGLAMEIDPDKDLAAATGAAVPTVGSPLNRSPPVRSTTPRLRNARRWAAHIRKKHDI